MGSFSIAAQMDNLNIDRLLRRKTIERTVSVLKIVFILVSIVVLGFTVSNAIENWLNAQSSITSLEKEVGDVVAAGNLTGTIKKESPDYAKITSSPIFGTLESAPADTKKETSKPISNVPLSLIGTFIATGAEPYAIIEDQKKREQEVFVIGESVFDTAKLVAIFSDRVEIDRAGKIEILALDDTIFSGAGSSSSSAGDSSASETDFDVDESELNNALNDLPLLLTQARAVPYFRDGRAIGLRLFAIKAGSLYQKIGLKNGDILKTVNGNNLGNIQEAMKLFETLKAERSISVELERNKQQKVFRYSIK